MSSWFVLGEYLNPFCQALFNIPEKGSINDIQDRAELEIFRKETEEFRKELEAQREKIPYENLDLYKEGINKYHENIKFYREKSNNF